MNGQTVIASFMIRLIRDRNESGEANGPGWRVVVRHIQSGVEVHFATLPEALVYVQNQADLLEQAAAAPGR